MIARDLFNETGAEFSDCRRYRYKLWRQWGEGPTVTFLMLNPSTADDVRNDPTVERQSRRIRTWAMQPGRLIVTNIFAWRDTDPAGMKRAADPVGPENDVAILWAANEAIRTGGMVVCAWGNHGEHLGRAAAVLRLLRGVPLYCLRVTQAGHPEHPLYLGYGLQPVRFQGERCGL